MSATALRSRRPRPLRRRGTVAVFLAISLPIVLLVCAFAMNVAYMHLARAELRAATDAAARAAAHTLSTTGDAAAAKAAAVAIAAENNVAGNPFGLDPNDVLVGESTRPSTTSRYAFAQTSASDNAVKVLGRGPVVSLLFGPVLSRQTVSPIQESIATFTDVDICLVLDRSSSMKLAIDDTAGLMSTSDSRFCQPPDSDSRWVTLDSAVAEFVSVINTTVRNEHVSLVTYASDYTSCGVTSTESEINVALTSDSTQLTSGMSSLSSSIWNGATCIDAGIRKGVEALTDPVLSRNHAKKVMILLTDGVYTGWDPVPEATTAASHQITVHTITFSAGANQTDMQNVASAGGGYHYHAPDAATLNEVFRKLAAMPVLLTD